MRYVVVKDGLDVINIIACDTTAEANLACTNVNKKAVGSASWYKADTIDDLAERDPYVHIWCLKKQIEELTPKASDEKPKELPKFWPNGRARKSISPKS